MSNKTIFIAEISWIDYKDGGRQNIPTINEKYYPIIVIEEDRFDTTNSLWSSLIINKKFINSNKTQAELSYLLEDAPDKLTKNCKFKLYEGSKLVANGVVVDVNTNNIKKFWNFCICNTKQKNKCIFTTETR